MSEDPQLEISIEGEDTKEFRITSVNYRFKEKSKQKRKYRHVLQGPLSNFGEDNPNNSDVDDDEEDKNNVTEEEELIFASIDDKACVYKQVKSNSSPSCRIFGVYYSYYEQNKRPKGNTLERTLIKRIKAADLELLSEKNLAFSASFVPYRVLNYWIDQLLAQEEAKASICKTVKIILKRQETIQGALLVADVSHFSKLARVYGNDDYKNVSKSNTRSIAAERLFKMLYQNIFHVLVDLIAKAGGDIIKFVGDSIFAIFPIKDEDATKSAKKALHVVLESFAQLKRKVHYGIGIGSVTYNIIGKKRIEGFLSGEALKQATSSEEHSSNFSDLSKFVPLVVSKDFLNNLKNENIFKIFEPLENHSKEKELVKDKYFILLKNNKEIKIYKKSYIVSKSLTIAKMVKQKLFKILESARKTDILCSILALTAPNIVSSYINQTGVSLWATELRVCTPMFIHISGEWDDITDQKLNLLDEVLAAIQTSVKDFGGEFLRFVVDDKGAYCFVAFGLRAKIVAQNALRATLCAMNIHQKVVAIKSKYTYRRVNSMVKDYSQGIEKEKEDLVNNLGICAGITTGKVICANVGNNSRCEYTLHGECVNFAANLMGHAKSLPKHLPRVLCAKEVYKVTKSHIAYKNELTVCEHTRKMERSQINGKDVTGIAYIVKATKLPRFSLRFEKHGQNEKRFVYTKEEPLVRRIHEKSTLTVAIQEYITDREVGVWGVIIGNSGMGKTSALGKLYNTVKQLYKGVYAFFIKLTNIETNSRLFVLRAILLQLVKELETDLTDVWPTTLNKVYDFVTLSLKDLIPVEFDQFKSMLTAIFKPEGSSTKEGFNVIGIHFKALLKLLIGKRKCIFMFDEWDLMNSKVSALLLQIIEELHFGLVVTQHSINEVAFHDRRNFAHVQLYPLRPRDFQSVSKRWSSIPFELLKYIIEMVNGNPKQAEELLRIVKTAGWIQKDSIGRNSFLSLEAFSCIHDKKLEYRDFIFDITETVAQQPEEFFLPSPTKTQISKIKRQKGVKKTAKEIEEDRSIKFTEYFDENMYYTEEKLNGYLDQASAIQHMCLKVGAILGLTFKLKDLKLILSKLNDDVLTVEKKDKEEYRGKLKALTGDKDLSFSVLNHYLKGLKTLNFLKIEKEPEDIKETIFSFVTPLLHEVTLNIMPHYFKEEVYKLVAKTMRIEVENDNNEEKLFAPKLEYYRFFSVYSIALNEKAAFHERYYALKQIEKHCYYTGEVKYYFDSMATLHSWHKFYILEKRKRSKSLKKLVKLSDDEEKSFKNWYKALDKIEIGRSLRIGAQMTLWFSTQVFAQEHRNREHAKHITRTGIRWLEKLIDPTLMQIKLKLELVNLYAIDYLAKKCQSISEYPPLKITCAQLYQYREKFSIIQEAEFSLPFAISIQPNNVPKCINFSESLQELSIKANKSDLQDVEKRFIKHTIARTHNFLILKVKEAKVPTAMLSSLLLTRNGLTSLELEGWLESDSGNDLAWRDEKMKYLENLSKSVSTAKTSKKKMIKNKAKQLIRKTFGIKWIENENNFIENGSHIGALYNLAKAKEKYR